MAECQTIAPGSMETIYRDSRLLVVSKPAFLRMNGEFPDTVKSRLKKEHGLDDESIKPVHQLDYSTSGVLVTALQKQAAAVCTSLFAERLSKKAYVAVVECDVDRPDFRICLDKSSRPALYGEAPQDLSGESMPVSRPPKGENPPSSDTISPKPKEKIGCDSFPLLPAKLDVLGYPDFAVQVESAWPGFDLKSAVSVREGETHSNRQESSLTGGLPRSAASGAGSDGPDPSDSTAAGAAAAALAGPPSSAPSSSWQPTPFTTWLRRQTEAASSLPSARSGAVAGRAGAASAPPAVGASASSSSSSGGSIAGTSKEPETPGICFRLELPVAQAAPKDFRMCWGSDAPGRQGRRASTLGVLTHKGTMRGRPVARLLLFPRSGRRHQLRVHAAALGMPICGDGVYGATLSSPRMALHALSLHLPFGDLRALRRKTFRKVIMSATTGFDFAGREGPSAASGPGALDACAEALAGEEDGAAGAEESPGAPPDSKRRRVDTQVEEAAAAGGGGAAGGEDSLSLPSGTTSQSAKGLEAHQKRSGGGSRYDEEDRQAAARVLEHLRLSDERHGEVVATLLPCRPLTFSAPDPFADLVAMGRDPASVRPIGSPPPG